MAASTPAPRRSDGLSYCQLDDQLPATSSKAGVVGGGDVADSMDGRGLMDSDHGDAPLHLPAQMLPYTPSSQIPASCVCAHSEAWWLLCSCDSPAMYHRCATRTLATEPCIAAVPLAMWHRHRRRVSCQRSIQYLMVAYKADLDDIVPINIAIVRLVLGCFMFVVKVPSGLRGICTISRIAYE